MDTKEIEIIQPDDFHHHLRDGDVLPDVVKFASKTFSRIIVMPNINPPVKNVYDALQYKNRIIKFIPKESNLQLLMTIYLTDQTTEQDIINAKNSGFIFGAKLYPSGVTTNSQFGVTSIKNIYHVFKIMEDIGLKLLIHGEVTNNNIDIFDREKIFIDKILIPIINNFPNLKIIMEHITTKEAVEFIKNSSSNIAATITIHHLLYNRNYIFNNGICPHMYCLPIFKREEHRIALLEAATSNNPKFFLGTDSAPHSIESKHSSCGCAGIFTSHIAIELCAEIFDSINKLDRLENFCSIFGAKFYQLPINYKKIKLIKKSWKVPDSYIFGNSLLYPLKSGEFIKWKQI